MGFTKDKIDQYHTQGFVRLDEPLFPEERFKSLEKLARTIVDRNTSNPHQVHVYELIKKYPDFLYYIFDKRVLGLVGQLIGPDIGLLSTTAFIKLPGTETHFKWHNDFYEDMHFEDISKIDTTALLIAIDPSNEETGCLKFIPGSHKRIRRKYNQPNREDPAYINGIRPSNHGLDDSEVDLTNGVVSVDLPRGFCSFHDIFSVHSSEPNKATYERILLNIQFFNTNIADLNLSEEAIKYLQMVSKKKIHLQGKDPLKTCFYSMIKGG